MLLNNLSFGVDFKLQVPPDTCEINTHNLNYVRNQVVILAEGSLHGNIRILNAAGRLVANRIFQTLWKILYIGSLQLFSERLIRKTVLEHKAVKYRVRQITSFFFFFEKCLKRKTTKYFLKFFLFCLKVQSFHLIMENNFIEITGSAGHAVAYTIGPIFKHTIDCVQLYFANGFTNIVL